MYGWQDGMEACVLFTDHFWTYLLLSFISEFFYCIYASETRTLKKKKTFPVIAADWTDSATQIVVVIIITLSKLLTYCRWRSSGNFAIIGIIPRCVVQMNEWLNSKFTNTSQTENELDRAATAWLGWRFCDAIQLVTETELAGETSLIVLNRDSEPNEIAM